MASTAKVAALVTAAGSSARMGPPRAGESPKKEYRPLPGSPGHSILSSAVRPFAASGLCSIIVITHPEGDADRARSALSPDLLSPPSPPIVFAVGGSSRRRSVLKGLEALAALPEGAPDIVLVHDGARPWLDASLVERVLEETRASGAAVPLVPSVDSLKEVDAGGRIVRHLEREWVMAVQTPQGFRFPQLLEAHRRAEQEARAAEAEGRPFRECTDDAEIWDRFVGSVSSVPGDPSNRKVTRPEDLR